MVVANQPERASGSWGWNIAAEQIIGLGVYVGFAAIGLLLALVSLLKKEKAMLLGSVAFLLHLLPFLLILGFIIGTAGILVGMA